MTNSDKCPTCGNRYGCPTCEKEEFKVVFGLEKNERFEELYALAKEADLSYDEVKAMIREAQEKQKAH